MFANVEGVDHLYDAIPRAAPVDALLANVGHGPGKVSKDDLDAMWRGEGDVVSGWKNKLQTTPVAVIPSGVLAERHRKIIEPGSGGKLKSRQTWRHHLPSLINLWHQKIQQREKQ